MGLKKIGLVYYGAKLYSVITGTIFVLITTRSLSVEDFGIWTIISNIISYFVLFSPVINYWIIRFRARGEEKATSTGLFLSLIISLLLILIFLCVSPFLSSLFNFPINLNHLIILYIPLLYLLGVLYSAVYSLDQISAAISEIIFETMKVLLLVLLFILSRVTLQDLLLVLFLAYIIQTVFLTFKSWDDIKRKPSMEFARKIIKLSWLNFYGLLSKFVINLDIPILSYLKSNVSVAYYSVGIPFTRIISHSQFLAAGLYPALLKGEKARHISESLQLVILFSIPTTAGILLLAPELLYVLKPEYVIASDVLRILSLAIFFETLYNVLNSSLQGIETTDKETSSFRRILKSKLFISYTFAYLKALILIPGIVIFSFVIKGQLETALLGRAVYCLSNIVLLILAYRILLRNITFKFPWKEMMKYIFSALLMCLLVSPFHPLKIREIVGVGFLGASVYFIILYLIDRSTRSLIKKILISVKITLQKNFLFST